MHTKYHWTCCALPIVGTIFWVAAVLSTVLAWASVMRNDLVLGYGAQWWVINALIFGLLALFGGNSKHSCGHHMDKPSM